MGTTINTIAVVGAGTMGSGKCTGFPLVWVSSGLPYSNIQLKTLACLVKTTCGFKNSLRVLYKLCQQ